MTPTPDPSPPRRDAPPRLGDRFGAFELLQELGRGGMGVVYRARDSVGRDVALKLILSRKLSPELRARFQREGEVAASLDHPGLAKVWSAGEVEGVPYLAYELVEGARDLIEASQPLSLAARVELVGQAAEALGHMHARGIVHRDVKPENLLVDAAGRVRVVDFGLGLPREAERLTQTGGVVGTPAYMSPEHVSGDHALTPAADVWALGVVLYRLLTGARPFGGGNLLAIAHEIRTVHPARPRQSNPEVPAHVEAACLQALSKRPEDRYPDGLALAQALRGAPSSSRRGWWGGGVLAVAVAAVALGLGLRARLAANQGPRAAPARPSPSSPAPPTAPALPAWVQRLAPALRPPSPLPLGLRFTDAGVVNVVDGSELVWIPPGRFDMGDPDGEPTEQLVHPVTLNGYFLGKHEVTWEQLRRFCAETQGAVPSAELLGLAVPFVAGPRDPAFHVTWRQAQAYCDWAGLVLPTEREWEYAARGDDPTRRFPWGARFDPHAALANLADASTAALAPADFGHVEADYDDGYPFVAPVGSFPAGASPFGCLDMAGNVWEITADAYAPYPTQASRPDPGASRRVIRGGGWDTPSVFSRATRRGALESAARHGFVGFRVCLR